MDCEIHSPAQTSSGPYFIFRLLCSLRRRWIAAALLCETRNKQLFVVAIQLSLSVIRLKLLTQGHLINLGACKARSAVVRLKTCSCITQYEILGIVARAVEVVVRSSNELGSEKDFVLFHMSNVPGLSAPSGQESQPTGCTGKYGRGHTGPNSKAECSLLSGLGADRGAC